MQLTGLNAIHAADATFQLELHRLKLEFEDDFNIAASQFLQALGRLAAHGGAEGHLQLQGLCLADQRASATRRRAEQRRISAAAADAAAIR